MDGLDRPEPRLPDGITGRQRRIFWRPCLILGLLIRPAAAVLAFAMVVAIVTVHIGNGLFMSNDGYEFGLALLAASVALAISGAGRGSLDVMLSRD